MSGNDSYFDDPEVLGRASERGWATAELEELTSTCKFCKETFLYKGYRRARRKLVCDKCSRSKKRRQAALEDRPIPEPRLRRGTPDILGIWSTETILKHRKDYIDGPVFLEHNSGQSRRTLFELSADGECEHGRLPGDPCPSPRVFFEARGEWGAGRGIKRPAQWVQNWPQPEPCDCWGGR